MMFEGRWNINITFVSFNGVEALELGVHKTTYNDLTIILDIEIHSLQKMDLKCLKTLTTRRTYPNNDCHLALYKCV